MIASGRKATSGRSKVLIAKSMEMKAMAMPERVDKSAARGVARRIRSATKDPENSITPETKQAARPMRQASIEASWGV